MKISTVNDFSALVRQRRKELGWTQATLAKEIGTGQVWVSQFERGKASVQLELVLRALRVLDINLNAGPPAQSPESSIDADFIDIDEHLKGYGKGASHA